MKVEELLKTPPTKHNFLSLGAGVQSSCLALMAKHKFITPMPDAAIFADTQAEEPQTYEYLNFLKEVLPFPVYEVTKGDLTAETLKTRYFTKDNKQGKKGETYLKRIIPCFGKMPNGEKLAALGRSCTADYKIQPVTSLIKKLSDKPSPSNPVTQWLGISYDEIQRMKDSPKKWLIHRFPLIEKRIHRQQCLEWIKAHGYPEPPRSACYYCPFHSDEEWRRIRNDNPEYFKKAVEYDKKLRQSHKELNPSMKMETFLHRSCKPLDQVDFDSDEDKGQQTWDFMAECEGLCGV